MSGGDFRRLADFAPVMIWAADPDRRSVYFNRPWLDFTGRPADDELGFGWTEGIHPEDRAAAIAAIDAAYSSFEPFETEYRLRRHDDEYRWLLHKGVPLVAEDGLCGFVGSCLDITDRRIEDEKRAGILATVSHELRSPLNGIKTWAHVLEDHLRSDDATVKRALAGILTGVEHQVRLIEDLLDTGRK